jgi:hypothetical protein
LFSDQPEKYHVNVAEGLTTASAVAETNSKYVEFFAQQIEKCQCDKILFSGEDLILLSDSGLKRLKRFFSEHFGPHDVKVIFYLRAPHEWYASLVQQWVRGGWVLEDLLNRDAPSIPNIRSKIEPYVRSFGADHILVGKFEDAISHKDGPVGHLLSFVSTEKDVPKLPTTIENRGLCAEAVTLISALNKIERSTTGNDTNGVARDYLEPFFELRGARFVLPEQEQVRAWKAARESLDWIEDTFGIEAYKTFAYQEQPIPMWSEQAISSIAEIIRATSLNAGT